MHCFSCVNLCRIVWRLKVNLSCAIPVPYSLKVERKSMHCFSCVNLCRIVWRLKVNALLQLCQPVPYSLKIESQCIASVVSIVFGTLWCLLIILPLYFWVCFQASLSDVAFKSCSIASPPLPRRGTVLYKLYVSADARCSIRATISHSSL